jgi:glycosyltransferase involved in cell wall biosynthesis
VPARDAAALAAATVELIGDRPEAERLGHAARELLEERFTFAGMVAGTLSVYAELGVG